MRGGIVFISPKADDARKPWFCAHFVLAIEVPVPGGPQGRPIPDHRQRRRKFMASGKNPFVFLQQVRQETAKVTWPTRRETLISSVMVVIFAIIASIFFLAADQLIAWLISLVYNFGA
jgi:preprotein translocase subunit SecE